MDPCLTVPLLLVVWLVLQLCRSADICYIPLTVIAPRNNAMGYDYEEVRPGIEIAMDKALALYHVSYRSTRKDVDYKVIQYNAPCGMTPSRVAVGLTYDAYDKLYKTQIATALAPNQPPYAVFLSPACSVDFTASATIYSQHKMGPFITGGAHYTTSSDLLKGRVRVAYSAQDVWQPIFAMWVTHNWTDINIIYYHATSDDPALNSWEKLKTAYQPSLEQRLGSNKASPFKIVYIDHKSETNVVDNLNYAGDYARINVLLLPSLILRQYLVTASSLGMTTGDHVYFAVDLNLDNTPIAPDFTPPLGWSQGDGNDSIAKEAYRSLFVIALPRPQGSNSYQKFQEELTAWYAQNPTYKRPDLIKNPSYYMFTHHDAVLIPAIFEKALDAAGNANDYADQWIRKISSTTYDYLTHGTRLRDSFYIDPSGNMREAFDVYDMTDHDKGFFSRIATYSTVPITLVGQYLPVPNVLIDWATSDNNPPLNKDPNCPFRGCPPGPDNTWKYAVGGVSLIPLAVLTFGGYRLARLLYIRRKEQWTWIIAPTELKVRWPNGDVTEGIMSDAGGAKGHHEPGFHGRSMGSSLHGTHDCTGPVAMFMPYSAIWKKQLVVLRHSCKKKLPLCSNVVHEVQFVRSLNHANVLKFLRATVQPYHVAVVYESAARGTIIDLINQKSAMDWDVRYAFISDIINGLQYLYSKGLHCHSRLTSKCLFLDWQFVVKIGDYGLNSFFDMNIVELWVAKRDPEFCLLFLWTAPEVLKECERPSGRTSQILNKFIDVYSFGIILQELILWSRPYSMFSNLTAEEVVNYVIQGQNADGVQMRPHFDLTEKGCNFGLIELAQLCWSEHSYDRPDWTEIHTKVGQTQKITGVRPTESVLDSLVEQLEELNKSLVQTISDKEAKILQEQEVYHKTLMLFVPKRLINGIDQNTYYPREFESATIVCQDVLTPTFVRVQSTPAEVIQSIGHIYHVVMQTVAASPLTKFAKMSDTFFAVAGIPESDENHAVQAANYALDLLSNLTEAQIPSKPDIRMQTRITFTTGTLTGGILTTPIPRFFVSGEPIGASLRLLYSMGQSSGIVVDQSSKDLLNRTDFVTEARGYVPFGNGRLMSYWLHGTHEQLEYKFSVHDPVKSHVIQRSSFLLM